MARFRTNLLGTALALTLLITGVSLAGTPSPAAQVNKLHKIGESAMVKLQKIAGAADTAIDKAAAKGNTAKALAAAERARQQLSTLAAKTHASLDKTHDAIEHKLTSSEDSEQAMLALEFAAHRLETLIDQHLTLRLDELDQSLADAGISQ